MKKLSKIDFLKLSQQTNVDLIPNKKNTKCLLVDRHNQPILCSDKMPIRKPKN